MLVAVLALQIRQTRWFQMKFNRAKEARHLQPEAAQPEAASANAATNAATNAAQGFYIGKDNEKVFVNYGTADAVMQSFMRSVMAGNYDASAKGREIFKKICATCHQPDGSGKDGIAPPLAGSEWVLAPSGERLVRIVLNGLNGPITVRGRVWNQPMLAWRNNFDDEQIAVVLTFIRTQLGDNKAGSISPETVAAARKETHPNPETEAELLRIPVH